MMNEWMIKSVLFEIRQRLFSVYNCITKILFILYSDIVDVCDVTLSRIS